MRHAKMVIVVLLGELGLAGTARAQAPAGGLKLSGTSTVGDWACREPTIQPAASSPGLPGLQPAGEPAPQGMTLVFPVRDIECGNALMNDHLRQALKADRNPTISFSLPSSQLQRAVQGGSAPVVVDGTLTIAGRTEPVRTEVTATPIPGHGFRVRGEQMLRMSSFGVKAPRLLLGALKVRDLVRVAFDLVLRGPAVALLGHHPPGLTAPLIAR